MNRDFALSEMDRRLSRMARVGRVSEVDYSSARVRVIIGELVSGWLQWMTSRAGPDRDWWAPEIDEQVLILAPDGELATAVVLGSLYQNIYPAPALSADIRRIEFADGSWIENDRAASVMRLHAAGDLVASITGNANMSVGGDMTATVAGDAAITAGGSIALTAPTISLTGNLNAAGTGGGQAAEQKQANTVHTGSYLLNGDLTVNGNIIASGNIGAGGNMLAAGASDNHHSHP